MIFKAVLGSVAFAGTGIALKSILGGDSSWQKKVSEWVTPLKRKRTLDFEYSESQHEKKDMYVHLRLM